jgi:PKHD-type hydroxylase
MNATGHFISPPERGHFNTHFQYTATNRMFSPPECDALIGLGHKVGFGQAAIGNPDQSRISQSYRCASVALLDYRPDTAWLYEKITRLVQAANAHYQFELSGLLEALQVIRYDTPENIGASVPGHYDWHQDFGGGYMARRKLSLVAQLSDPAEYDGCRLTIMDPHPRELAGPYIERGAGVIFPSWTPHSVSNITRGCRYALVAWVHGSPFR